MVAETRGNERPPGESFLAAETHGVDPAGMDFQVVSPRLTVGVVRHRLEK